MMPSTLPVAYVPDWFRDRSLWDTERWNLLEWAVQKRDGVSPYTIFDFGCRECGVALWLAMRTSRIIHAIDRFDDGLSVPVEADGGWLKEGEYAIPFDQVQPYTEMCPRLRLHKMDIRREIPMVNRAVGLVIIDVDLYEPTLAALKWLKYRQFKGTALVDDVAFSGVRKALDVSGWKWEEAGHMGIIES